ncbi:MAG TPA: hypothetical protein VHN18_12575, partial [Micromonosporaceae bacterium]|nr:hypothetical protein [Micromonosporaceae bacterium]
MKKLPLAIISTAVAVIAVTTAATVSPSPTPRPAAPTPSPSPPVRAAQTPYQGAVDAAHERGLRVWIEADLVERWLAGKDSFREGVLMIAALAARPGVVGIKIADEIGYRDGLTSSAEIRAFLADSAAALRAAAPGKALLIDMVVPELGCLPNFQPPLRWATICAAQARGRYPQLTLDEVDGYLREHWVDVLNLSTGLLPDKTYAGWGVTEAIAQHTAWTEVKNRGWHSHVRMQARKALAHPGAYKSSDTTSVSTFIDIPRAEGAQAVDVWTWRQRYEGEIYRLLDPGLRPNALWTALAERRKSGAVLFTHLSPSSVEVDLNTDIATLGTVFTDLFVAAGT